MTKRIRMGDPLYFEISEFLHDENYDLDNRNYRDWLNRFEQENFSYTMPVRTNREAAYNKKQGSLKGFHDNIFFFEESYLSMVKRIERFETDFAWAEDPESRTRRFIDNVRIEEISENKYSVQSNFLVLRSRGNDTVYQILAGVRNDVLTKHPDGFKIQSREILVDQATLGTDNLAIFL